MSAEKITSPVGELEWVTISGKGKPNMSGKLEYKVDVVLEGEQAEALKKLIDDFWAEPKARMMASADRDSTLGPPQAESRNVTQVSNTPSVFIGTGLSNQGP